jgi:peptidoglycan/xylan/chitin deacetylase (PgdA/CDA1 family)
MAIGTMILCYHRVGEGYADPFHLVVTPENFAAHLDEIARHCEPSTLEEWSLPSRKPRVVVTFDDGYVDNLTNAVPIAEAKGMPITVYVTSGMVGEHRGFWWDRLGTLLRSRPSGIREVRITGPHGPVTVGIGARTLDEDLQAVRQHLLPLPVDEIHRALDEIADEWGTSAAPPPDARTLTPAELGQLASSEVVTIGAHTTDHVHLSSIEPALQQATISSSKRELEKLCQRSVSHFAYPFGGADSFDADSVKAVRDSGFKTACTTIGANARSGSDPHRLPRRLVMNWSRMRFRVGLERWKLVTGR